MSFTIKVAFDLIHGLLKKSILCNDDDVMTWRNDDDVMTTKKKWRRNDEDVTTTKKKWRRRRWRRFRNDVGDKNGILLGTRRVL